jgi:hypothetical protein
MGNQLSTLVNLSTVSPHLSKPNMHYHLIRNPSIFATAQTVMKHILSTYTLKVRKI